MIEEKECPNCLKRFKPYYSKQIYCKNECYFLSDSLKEKASNSLLIKNNGEWKGNFGNIKENPSSSSLHEWIRRYKPYTGECEICGNKVQDGYTLDAANISGDYKRDIEDFAWLCRSCHAIYDRMRKKSIYEIIGVEAKMGKYLDAEEKKKMKWLLEHKIFQKIFIAYPSKKRGEINYDVFV